MQETNFQVGIVGAGAMGSGIAQVAAIAGHEVVIYDSKEEALIDCKNKLEILLRKLEQKGKITNAQELIKRFSYESKIEKLSNCKLVIEAIIENIDIKKSVFNTLEGIVSQDCILASNTSSISIAAIASACKNPERVVGIHFFNPASRMLLVEIIPAIQTRVSLASEIKKLILSWGKIPVIAKDTPGFIVNRVARPFYGEALRIYEEGIADIPTIDWAMTEIGGFKMGPFTLMDYIGHDVNYIVTETVFKSFFYDPRFKPALSQKRLLEAGWLGRKSDKGFYDYGENPQNQEPVKDEKKGKQIVHRILFMLINEALDAQYLGIASKEDIELAMTKGVNYPKGLLQWCEELGSDYVLSGIDHLYETYHEDRYRASVLLREKGEIERISKELLI